MKGERRREGTDVRARIWKCKMLRKAEEIKNNYLNREGEERRKEVHIASRLSGFIFAREDFIWSKIVCYCFRILPFASRAKADSLDATISYLLCDRQRSNAAAPFFSSTLATSSSFAVRRRRLPPSCFHILQFFPEVNGTLCDSIIVAGPTGGRRPDETPRRSFLCSRISR